MQRLYPLSTGPCPCLHVPVSRNQHAWLQGSIRTMVGGPEILPCRSHPPPLLLSLVLVLALARVASHLPTREAVRLSGGLPGPCSKCVLSAYQVPRSGSSHYVQQAVNHGTHCLSICQSVNQPDNRFIN